MRALVVLALCGAAFADTPLGPYFRPGVPVLRGSELDGTPDPALEPVPPGVLLAAVFGDAPEDLERRLTAQAGHEVRVLSVEGPLADDHWPALDVFDRIYVVHRPVAGILRHWVRAGGSLVVVGRPGPVDAGLGRVYVAEDLDAAIEASGPVAPPLIPRAPAVLPALYDLVRAPVGPAPALRTARWVVWGTLAALAIQVLLAAAGILRGRLFHAVVSGVACAGALVGALRTADEYTPVACGRIEVAYLDGGTERLRSYLVYTRVGPGARVPDHDRPVLYREGGPAWGAGLDEGVIRVFLEESVRAGRPRLEAGAGPFVDLLASVAPAGWTAAATPRVEPPAVLAGSVPLLGRLELAVQN